QDGSYLAAEELAAAGSAGAAGGGGAGGLGAGAAGGLGAGSIAAICGGLLIAAAATYGIACYAGSRSGGHPVGLRAEKTADIRALLATPEGEREILRKVEEPASVRPASREAHAIWLVGDRKEVIVGRKSEIEEQLCRSLIGWGLGTTKVKDSGVSWQKV